MTRVLTICNLYPPHHLGGYELSCWDVMRRLTDRGHEITVLTSDTRQPDVVDPPDESDIRRELTMWLRDHNLWNPSLPTLLTRERANQAALRRALSETRAEVASLWHMGALSMGLITTLLEARIPIVYAVCDDWLSYGVNLDPWTRRFAHHRLIGRVVRRVSGLSTELPDLGATGAFLFVSEETARRSAQYTGWTFPISSVVYSGIERADFRPPATERTRPWRWRLLVVGRLDPRKGFETVVRALPLLPPDATLRIVGPGDDAERDRLRSVAALVGVSDRVAFDTVRRDELADIYRAADVFVFPSLWEEPFGLVPVEAMACHTPVVATCTGGTEEFLADEVNCLRFSPGDSEALAATVRRLADDPNVRARLVRAGEHTAQEFDTDRLADTFEAWHDAAASGFAHGYPPARRLTIAQTPAAHETT
jgi:glycogen(starch) synthase